MLLKEDIDTLFEGIEVSDELKEAFGVKFQSLVTEKLNEFKKESDEANKIILEAEKEVIKEDHEEKIDSFMNYGVQEWIKENKLAIESGIKVEAAEKLISGISNLLKEFNITVDENANGVIDAATAKISKLESELTSQITENFALSEEITSLKKEKVIDKVCSGLAESEKEKFIELIADIEFTDSDKYAKKISIVKESKFKKEVKQPEQKVVVTEQKNNSFISAIADKI